MSHTSEQSKSLPFDLLELVKAFKLEKRAVCKSLEEWTEATFQFDDLEERLLRKAHARVVKTGSRWNEEELKIRFVGAMFEVANLEESKNIDVFFERSLEDTVNNYALSVKCDCMVARTLFELPDAPYFFLQEFKKERGDKKDPEAQMLTAMLIAQHKNNDQQPVYGGYVIGTNWWFTTLHGSDYCASRKYDATRLEDVYAIASVLRQLKYLIAKR